MDVFGSKQPCFSFFKLKRTFEENETQTTSFSKLFIDSQTHNDSRDLIFFVLCSYSYPKEKQLLSERLYVLPFSILMQVWTRS